MKTPTLLYAIAVALPICAPMIAGSQGGLGFFDREARIYRKAKRYNLVSVEKVAPDVFIDMRYKVTSAAEKPLYREDMPCLVHRATGRKLDEASEILESKGYGLALWDAWRPPEAHRALWEAVRDPRFVVPPSRGLSWHCYGISVDVTLVKLDGDPLEMPSEFDEFSDRAKADYTGGDPDVAKRVALLQEVMRDLGFRSIESEWWHFDDMKAGDEVRRVTAADLGIRMP